MEATLTDPATARHDPNRWNVGTVLTRWGPALFVIALLVVTTWPVETLEPASGIDPSWEAAVHLAPRAGLMFGTEFLFTYGPFGYLTVAKLLFTPQTVASLLFIAAIQITLVATAFGRLSRPLPVIAAAVLTYLLVRTATTLLPSQAIVAVGFVLSIAALQPGRSRRAGMLFALAAGAACGLLMLVRVNDAIALGGVTFITVLARSVMAREPRFLVVYSTAFIVVFVAGWFGAGQATDALPAYIYGSLQLASGYSAAMGTEATGREWEYGAAFLLAAGVLALAWQTAVTWSRPATWAAMIITALFLFVGFKHGFVRHDGHVIGYFVVCALILPAFARRVRSLTWAGTAIGALLAVTITSGAAIGDQFEPASPFEMFTEQFGTMVDSSARERTFAEGRESVRDALGLDDAAAELVAGRSVHIDPWEASLAWAYYGEFHWRPAPVFQTYAAYTSQLDELNATYIASARGPERILRQSPRPIDGRNPMWESPLYAQAMICNYRELWAGPNWQVLGRTPDQCGEPRVIRRGIYEFMQPISVPAGRPDEVVIARFHGLRGSVSDSLITLLYKPAPTLVNVDDMAVYRLVAATATNGIVVGAPDAARYSHPYSLAPQIDHLTIFTAGPNPPADETFTVEFVAVPFRAEP